MLVEINQYESSRVLPVFVLVKTSYVNEEELDEYIKNLRDASGVRFDKVDDPNYTHMADTGALIVNEIKTERS